MKKVLIVIPAYNAASYINETLKSVLSSTYKNLVVLVVNDGSTDQTVEIVSTIHDDRLVLVSRPNSGMSASRNFGIDYVDSDFIALLDSDDIWHARKLELQINFMQENPGVDFCFTGFERYYGQGAREFLENSVDNELDTSLSGYIYHQMILDNWALPSSVVFTRNLWLKMGPFHCDNQQTDDWEYFVRASLTFQFAKLKSPLVLYRQHPHSLSRRVPKLNSCELMRDGFIEKYGLRSPQGTMVDVQRLNRLRYIRQVEFYDSHVSRGELLLGISGFLGLLHSHGDKFHTLNKFARSTLRRSINLVKKGQDFLRFG